MILGERARNMLIAGLVMGSYEKRFKNEGPHSWINTDYEAVKKYCDDPLCNYVFTLNGFENLVRLTLLTYEKGGYAMNNPDLPIRFYSGADDPCAVDEKAWGKAVSLLKQQGYNDVEGKMYQNMRHEILNEPEHLKVYEDILGFISINI